uniref:Uncharacterized protein n=1 Tax=Schizaphis graminum TaxID=13262 RepID=A0A2S2NHK4_SCHGA
MNNTVCTRTRRASQKSTNKRNRTCKTCDRVYNNKMDEIIMASTRETTRRAYKEGEKDATSSKRKKINTIFRCGPSKATTAAVAFTELFFPIINIVSHFFFFFCHNASRRCHERPTK